MTENQEIKVNKFTRSNEVPTNQQQQSVEKSINFYTIKTRKRLKLIYYDKVREC